MGDLEPIPEWAGNELRYPTEDGVTGEKFVCTVRLDGQDWLASVSGAHIQWSDKYETDLAAKIAAEDKLILFLADDLADEEEFNTEAVSDFDQEIVSEIMSNSTVGSDPNIVLASAGDATGGAPAGSKDAWAEVLLKAIPAILTSPTARCALAATQGCRKFGRCFAARKHLANARGGSAEAAKRLRKFVRASSMNRNCVRHLSQSKFQEIMKAVYLLATPEPFRDRRE